MASIKVLNLVSAVLIVPYSIIKFCLSILMFLPEIILHRFHAAPEAWWFYDVKNRNWLARTFPVFYWHAVRNTLPWLRVPLFAVQYTVQDPRFINIESVDLLKAGKTRGWRFTRYKYLLAEVEFVRTRPASYDEYRFGWGVEGRKLKITTQVRRGREYGK